MASRPVPYPDALTAPYWAQAKAGVFALPRCEDCGAYHFYPQPACPHCHGDRVVWRPASGRGTIYSYSVVHRAPSAAFADDVPYVIAIIATAEGPHLMSRIVNIPPANVRIGLPVRVRFEKVTDDVALPLFEPAENGA